MRYDHPQPPRALTLDLDDTLWPIWPTIHRAEAVLQTWFLQHAPATAARFDIEAMRALRLRVAEEHPDRAHDLGFLRLESIRVAMRQAGDDPGRAGAAFERFLEERQRVEFYPDALPALERLARRFPLLALSNGNADLRRVGLAPLFVGAVSASSFGVAKPHASIFHEACRQLGVAPAEVLHVGDDLQLDVDGALKAGLRAVWVLRESGQGPSAPDGAGRVQDLAQLADALGC